MKQLITVEYWPNTNKWRILVAGVAVGYWDDESEARMRVRQARRESHAALLSGGTSDNRASPASALLQMLKDVLADCDAANIDPFSGPRARRLIAEVEGREP